MWRNGTDSIRWDFGPPPPPPTVTMERVTSLRLGTRLNPGRSLGDCLANAPRTEVIGGIPAEVVDRGCGSFYFTSAHWRSLDLYFVGVATQAATAAQYMAIIRTVRFAPAVRPPPN